MGFIEISLGIIGWATAFFVPNFIIREILAVILAFFLPPFIVKPVNHITRIIFPPIIKFQQKMEQYPRIKTILPAFLAAEVILGVGGWVLLAFFPPVNPLTLFGAG